MQLHTEYHKRLVQMMATKRNEDYKDVINHIRTRVRFSLLRSVLIAVRGERGKKRSAQLIASVAFNMVPEAMQYDRVTTDPGKPGNPGKALE